jgi:serine/threonine protein kinase
MADDISPNTPADEPLINSCPSCGQLIDVSQLEPYSKIICQGCHDTIRVRTHFHHFQIKEQIGVGGMSRVFRATDTALKRDVALKILNRQCSSDERRVSQFEHEARITAAISHPNVVKVYSSGWDQGYFYIAMELVRGGSLDEKIRKDKRVGEARMLEVAIQTARGLKAAQAVGLIHRDIKPGNILFADDGTAKIVDFGLALMLAAVPHADKELWATPYYVPPEKLNGGTEDHRSDLYSLGASLYHAVLGKPPCTTDTNSLEELRALKNETVNLADEDAMLVSNETADLLECALQKDPEDRYVTYDDFIKHAEFARQTVLKGGGSRRRKRGQSKLMAAAAVLAAAAIGGGLTMALKNDPPPVVHDGGLQIVSDPTASENKTVSQEFTQARDAMFRGELPEARESFLKLAATAPQPTANWSIFNAGICALLQNDEKGARQNFNTLRPDSTDALGKFFTRMNELMNSPRPITVEETKGFDADGYDAMGLLAAGLKNWELGEARPAAAMLEKFSSGKPGGQASWVQHYHAVVAPHMADLAQLKGWPNLQQGNMTGTEAKAALAVALHALEQLKLPGAVKKSCESEIAGFQTRTAALLEAEKLAQEQQEKELEEKELVQFKQAMKEASAMEVDYHFPDAIARLQREVFKSIAIKEASADQVLLWKNAEVFLEQISKDFATGGWEGELIRADGVAMKAKIIAATRAGFRVQVPGSTGEVTLSYAQIQPAMLIRLAEQPLDDEKITDADDYYRRRELVVSFALKARQTVLGGLRGNELAREHRSFGERWKRLQPSLSN